jgi:hypothetical protein
MEQFLEAASEDTEMPSSEVFVAYADGVLDGCGVEQ